MAGEPTTEQLADNVRKSVRTAAHALDEMERALRQSGFAQGLDSYRRVCGVLIGQALWAEQHAPELRDEFARLGRRAASIHALLAPYAEIMDKLTALCGRTDEPTGAAEAPAVLDARPTAAERTAEGASELERDVVDRLAAAKRGLSFTRLVDAMGVDRSRLRACLEGLEYRGVIEGLSTSGRKLYRLRGHQR